MRVYVGGTDSGICLSLWNIGNSQAGQDLCAGPKSRRGRDDSRMPFRESPVTRKEGQLSKGKPKGMPQKLFLTKKNKYLTTLSSLDFRLFFCYFSLSGKILLHGLSGNVFIAVDTFLQREISKYAGVSSTGNTFFPDVPFPAP